MTDQEIRERFFRFVRKTETCWIWTGPQSDKGYGYFWYHYKNRRAHRQSWELHVGPIPKNMQLDHLCRVRNCVNPKHLQVVDARTNTRRGVGVTALNAAKTHCKNGHPYSIENTYIHRSAVKTSRNCILCRRVNQKKNRDAKACRAEAQRVKEGR